MQVKAERWQKRADPVDGSPLYICESGGLALRRLPAQTDDYAADDVEAGVARLGDRCTGYFGKLNMQPPDSVSKKNA